MRAEQLIALATATAMRVEDLERCLALAEDRLRGLPVRPAPAIERACRLLETALADGARDFSQILAIATEQGIPARTLRRAKARLRVRSLRASRGRGQRYLARWVLP